MQSQVRWLVEVLPCIRGFVRLSTPPYASGTKAPNPRQQSESLDAFFQPYVLGWLWLGAAWHFFSSSSFPRLLSLLQVRRAVTFHTLPYRFIFAQNRYTPQFSSRASPPLRTPVLPELGHPDNANCLGTGHYLHHSFGRAWEPRKIYSHTHTNLIHSSPWEALLHIPPAHFFFSLLSL